MAGRSRFTAGDETRDVGPGDSLYVAACPIASTTSPPSCSFSSSSLPGGLARRRLTRRRRPSAAARPFHALAEALGLERVRTCLVVAEHDVGVARRRGMGRAGRPTRRGRRPCRQFGAGAGRGTARSDGSAAARRGRPGRSCRALHPPRGAARTSRRRARMHAGTHQGEIARPGGEQPGELGVVARQLFGDAEEDRPEAFAEGGQRLGQPGDRRRGVDAQGSERRTPLALTTKRKSDGVPPQRAMVAGGTRVEGVVQLDRRQAGRIVAEESVAPQAGRVGAQSG